MWRIYVRVTRVFSLALLLGIHLSAQNHSNFNTIPLYFEQNKGQTDLQATYIARSPNLVGFVLQDGWTLSLHGPPISMHIAEANAKAMLVPEHSVEGITNYYLGSRAVTNLQHYSSVRAKDIRPGIDVVYHGSESDLEYDLVIHPGADINALWLRFDGSRPALADNGDIVLKTNKGEVRQHKPRVWQEAKGQRTEVECRYVLAKSGKVGFVLSNYDRSADLVIDPIISYSTFLGAYFPSGAGKGIAVDSSGFAYITGYTDTAAFTDPIGDANAGYGDVFVTKLNQTGTGLVYSTFIGGTYADGANGLAIDAGGNAYVAGSTNSSDFPFTVNQPPPSGTTHAFALKLGPTGNILYATALAGSGSDFGAAIAVDSSGSAYVAGDTTSSDFPVTAGSYQTTRAGGDDAFLAKLDSSGHITYATFLGGTADDAAKGIAVDSLGNAFVGGVTSSSNFPATPGAYSTALSGGPDAFVAKLNPTGSALIYATYLGGSATDTLSALAVDGAGNSYVAGVTQSTDFPTTPGAFSTSKGSGTVVNTGFVTKLNATGTSLGYSTFLGGNSFDYALGIAVDSTGSTYVAGYTDSSNFPTTAGSLSTGPVYSSNMFLSRISVDGGTLSYSATLGGGYGPTNPVAVAYAVALDGHGGVYLSGTAGTGSLYPTTTGAYQTSNATQTVFVIKIDLSVPTLCNPSIFPQALTLAGRGGAFSISLTLAPGCSWAAIPSVSSIKIVSPDHGVVSTSPIQISGTVAQNPSTSSGVTGTVSVGTAIFTINQDPGSCQDPVISPASVTFDSYGGTRNLSLTLPSSCAWTASSSAPWLTIAANPSGTGPASITVSATVDNVAPRSATLTVAGRPVPVTQTGSNCSATASVSVSGTSAQGGDGVVTITTNPSCAWHAYATVPWIQMNASAAAGQGSGVAPFIFAANPGSIPRSGQILIADVILNSALTVMQSAGPAGSIGGYTRSIFAGGGHGGDGGPATNAVLGFPTGLAFDPATGNLYLADSAGNNAMRIRVVTPDGNINAFAGGGTGTGENIPAPSALITGSTQRSLAVDGSSGVYINENLRVRKISQGRIATFAGDNTSGSSGDNGPATNAKFTLVNGLAADSTGNVYISDDGFSSGSSARRIRKVSGGIITNFAGGGNAGLGDNGPATSATLSVVQHGLVTDAAGNLLFTDFFNYRIRKVAQGIITTIAGGGNGGDGGPATSAALVDPSYVAVDPLGNIFFDEAFSNNRIHKISVDGTLSTIADGNLDNFMPSNLAADSSGNIYFSDRSNFGPALVHKLTALPSFCSYSVTPPPQIPAAGGPLQISVIAAAGCRWAALALPSWLTFVSANPGVGNGTLTFTVSANANVSVRSATLAIAGLPVQVTQAGGTPSLSVNRTTLNFASAGGIATSQQTVSVSFTGGAAVAWTATSNQSNIVVTQGSGTGNGSFQASASNGPNGTITVTAPNALGSAKQIQVAISTPSTGNPFGSFDTPTDNATGVAGAIPVTGWALDNVEVTKVDIWREPVGSEPAGALIYIGDSVFVEGARPDVEGLYPKFPFSYRAGWGYQMLTNFLPQGNGTFKLHAIAHNKAGGTADLGTKTIMVDNAHASKPFGTIDTPGQGGTASGSAFVNFGWALTQNPNKIPIDGSTISVVIDGQIVGHPTYNQFRSDIAALFPGYMNSSGAVGFFYIDTTTLTSGVHTISWNVFDNVGHGDGIGSRYFNVFNTGIGSVAEPEGSIGTEEIRNRAATVRERSPSSIEIEEVGLIELPLGATSGYQLVNGERRPLPIGSSLNRGVFYWQPGPGFLGDYNLVFERNDAADAHIRIKIRPKTFPRGI
jgi:Beta-propeller repeat/Viral BACON domain/Putative binding domain, N-terminal